MIDLTTNVPRSPSTAMSPASLPTRASASASGLAIAQAPNVRVAASRYLLALLAVASTTATGCGGVTPIDPGGPSTEGASPIGTTGVFDPDPDGGLDETGGDPGTCYLYDDSVFNGTVHQCGGEATITINYDNGPDNNVSFPFEKPFGNGEPNDPYVLSDVSACCTPIDTGLDMKETAHWPVCHGDLIVNICANLEQIVSMAALQDPANDPDVTADMNKIANWAHDNEENCIADLWADVEPIDENTGTVTATRTVPVGSIDGIESVESMSFSFEWTIDEIWLPSQSGDWLSCDSYEQNNNNPWSTGASEPSDYSMTADEVGLVMLGPAYSGGTVSASGDFDGPNLLKITDEGSNTWTLNTLALYSVAPVLVGNRDAQVEVSNFHMELLLPVSNVAGTSGDFTIPAGDAYFTVMGHGDGVPYVVVVRNQTAIDLERTSPTEWQTSAFGVQFVDPDSNTWNLTVSQFRGWE